MVVTYINFVVSIQYLKKNQNNELRIKVINIIYTNNNFIILYHLGNLTF